MTVERVCVGEVDTTISSETAQQAAQRMHDRKVGTLVVIDAQNRPIGMLTDRDLAVRIVAKGADPFVITVRDIMTPHVRTVRGGTPIEDALAVMRASSCRRLPVVDENGKLSGLVTLDDVLNLLAEEFCHIGKLVEKESPANLVQS